MGGESRVSSRGPYPGRRASAACRSTGRSRTTTGRATRASFAYRPHLFAKSASTRVVHSPSRTRRPLVSVSRVRVHTVRIHVRPRAWYAVDRRANRQPLGRTSSSSSLFALLLARANARVTIGSASGAREPSAVSARRIGGILIPGIKRKRSCATTLGDTGRGHRAMRRYR